MLFDLRNKGLGFPLTLIYHYICEALSQYLFTVDRRWEEVNGLRNLSLKTDCFLETHPLKRALF